MTFGDFDIASISADCPIFVLSSLLPRECTDYLTSILPDSDICLLCGLHPAEFTFWGHEWWLWYWRTTVLFIGFVLRIKHNFFPEVTFCDFDLASMSTERAMCLQCSLVQENVLVMRLGYWQIVVFVCCVVCRQETVFPEDTLCDLMF